MSRVSRVSRSSIVYVPKVTTRTSISRDYATSSGTLTWESALNDVLPVLKIQYRSDIGVSGFLNDSDKVRQLKFSSIARTEYNRRCIREECDFEMYSPPRARRIAKEVAIDWVRKYLDENDEKLEMVRKIQDIAAERDDVVEQVAQYQDENDALKREKDRLYLENCDVNEAKTEVENTLLNVTDELNNTRKDLDETALTKKDLELQLNRTGQDLEQSRDEARNLRDEIEKLKADNEKARQDNDKLRAECQDAYKVSAERRDEISCLKQNLESARADAARSKATSESTQKQNDDLNARNKCLNEKNLALRDEVNVFRAREEEMRTLVQIQQNILSPEKCKSDLAGVVRKTPEPAPKTPEPVAEEPEEEVVIEESEQAEAE